MIAVIRTFIHYKDGRHLMYGKAFILKEFVLLSGVCSSNLYFLSFLRRKDFAIKLLLELRKD